MVDQDTKQRAEEMASRDEFPIKGFSHLEWWVGNAYQSAQYLRTMFGFRIIGYRGPETGTMDTSSYLLAQEDIRFVVSAIGLEGPAWQTSINGAGAYLIEK